MAAATTTGNWGRKATDRIGRTQFSNDELLKTLGDQFNVDFAEYDQWKRKVKSTRVPASTLLLKQQQGEVTVSRASTSHSCVKHDRRGDALLLPRPTGSLAIKNKAEKLKILELRLKTRKKTLQEYKNREKDLLTKNMELRDEIDSRESAVHGDVKGLLRKYEKFRNGIHNLSSLFTKDMAAAMTSLHLSLTRITSEMKVLESEVATLDAKLKEKQKQLQVLQSYKDKEYPVKAMRISDLQKEIDDLKINNQEDQEELEHIINTELGKYEHEQDRTTHNVTEKVVEKAINLMHPSLKDMALQNSVMRKEIEFHAKERDLLSVAISILSRDVDALMEDPHTHTRYQMFPEFFPSEQICTPDMDVVLDIPKQTWLPI